MNGYMKKLIAAGLIASMIFAFAGCGESGGGDTEKTTAETQATEATEATTEEAAADYDIMDGFQLEEGDEGLLLYGNDFLLIMPNRDNWGYEQTSATTLEIYLKEARDSGYDGGLVTIMAFDPDDTLYEEFPSYAVAGTGPNCGKTFIAMFPTDVRFDPSNSQQQMEYSELSEYLHQIGNGDPEGPFRTRDSD